MTNKEVFTITEEEVDNRIDKILALRFDGISRAYFQHLIESENVLLNDSPTKKNVKPKIGDRVDIDFVINTEVDVEPEDIPLDILYEDDYLLAINKPPGLVVHPATGNWTGTVVNALLFHCQQLQNHPDPIRPGVVHRIDRGTSGVLIAAKNIEIQYELSQQFADRTVYKRYIGICLGNPGNKTIETLIKRHPFHWKKMFVHSEKGRTSKTICRSLAHNEELSVVEFIIETGRTHQIRVHMQHTGTPILGDKTYGSDSANKKYKATRQLLHSEQLHIIHPITQEKLIFKAPLPEDIIKVINKISKDFRYEIGNTKSK